VGVVFRRGPTKLVRLVIWNRLNDKFKPGPWFKGRIYADRSDISADGKHLIYFAMGGVAWAIPETGGTWTAISKLPLLKATALWGQGGTRGGGGMFTSNKSFWLEADENTSLIRDDSGLRREKDRPRQSRLERDGWIARGRLLEKNVRGSWLLRRVGPDSGYELEQPGERKLEFPAWEWADWDRHRLVWAEGGCLRTAALGPHKLGSTSTLYDFNGMVPALASHSA
jgi:hypothetical protein